MIKFNFICNFSNLISSVSKYCKVINLFIKIYFINHFVKFSYMSNKNKLIFLINVFNICMSGYKNRKIIIFVYERLKFVCIGWLGWMWLGMIYKGSTYKKKKMVVLLKKLGNDAKWT